MNSPPGSKPILVDSGLASIEVETEVVVFDLELDLSLDRYNEAVAIAELAAYYGINASLVSVSAEVVTIERRRLTSSNDTTATQRLRLSVTIFVPTVVNTEAAGDGSLLTIGVEADASSPDHSTAERFASQLAQLNSAEGAGLSLLGANATLTREVHIKTVTQQVQENCPAGHWCSAGLKVECPQDTYQPLIDQIYAGACQKCPEFASSLPGSAHKSDCRCVEGYYDAINRLEDVACLPCPFGSVCQTSGSTLSTLPLLPGYWRTSNGSSDLRRCPDASSPDTTACANVDGLLCKPWTTGPYCSLCNLTDGSRYFDVSQSACMPCGDTAAMSLAPIVIIIIAVLLLLCWCSWKQPCKYLRTVGGRALSPMRAPVKQMITFYQALPFWHAAPVFYPLLTSVSPAFAQIATRVEAVFGVSMPASVAALFQALDTLNLSIDAFGLKMSCLQLGSFFNQLLFLVLMPYVFGLLILTCSMAVEIVTKGKATSLKAGLIRAVPYLLCLAFFAFPMVSSRAFQAFNCEVFDDGSRFLKVDYALDCDGVEYDRVAYLAWLAIALYPVCIPLVCLALLLSARKAILNEQPTALSRSLALLHRDYKPSMYWWEMVETGKKARDSLLTTLTPPPALSDHPCVCSCSSSASACLSVLAPRCNSSLASSFPLSSSSLHPLPSRSNAESMITLACFATSHWLWSCSSAWCSRWVFSLKTLINWVSCLMSSETCTHTTQPSSPSR